MLERQFQAPEGAVTPQEHGTPAQVPALWRDHAEEAGREYAEEGDTFINAHHARVQTQHVLEEEGAEFQRESGGCQQSPGQTMTGNAAKILDHLIDLS